MGESLCVSMQNRVFAACEGPLFGLWLRCHQQRFSVSLGDLEHKLTQRFVVGYVGVGHARGFDPLKQSVEVFRLSSLDTY